MSFLPEQRLGSQWPRSQAAAGMGGELSDAGGSGGGVPLKGARTYVGSSVLLLRRPVCLPEDL